MGQLLTSCVSRWVLVSHTLMGAYMHALVLLTGSVFVPIVAHTIFQAFCATVAHVKVFPIHFRADREFGEIMDLVAADAREGSGRIQQSPLESVIPRLEVNMRLTFVAK